MSQDPVSKPETRQRRLVPFCKVAQDLGKAHSWFQRQNHLAIPSWKQSGWRVTTYRREGNSDPQMTTWAPTMLISSRNTPIYKPRIMFDQCLKNLVAYSRWHTKITHQRLKRFNQQVPTMLEWGAKFRFPVSSTSGHGDVGSVTLVLGRWESVGLLS